MNTIKSISRSAKDIKPFDSIGVESYAYYPVSFNDLLHKLTKDLKFGVFPSSSPDSYRADPRPQARGAIPTRPTKAYVKEPMYFYEKIEGALLNAIFLSAVYAFEIRDNLGNTYTFDKPSQINDIVRMNTTSGAFMFDEVASKFPLIPGVYSVSSHYGGPELISSLLEENTTFMGIVSSNLMYSPGKEIYRISENVLIEADMVSKISGFEISPKPIGLLLP